MTKKHFEALAAIVRDWYRMSDKTPRGARMFVEAAEYDLATFCQTQNGRFDRARFIAACRGEDATDSAGRTVRYGVRA